MDSVLGLVSQLCTKEVGIVFGCIVTAWAGWRTVAWGWGVTSAILQKFSFLGLTAALLFIVGAGTTGLSSGEFVARIFSGPNETTTKNALTNRDLVYLAEKAQTPEMAKIVIDYAKLLDQNQNTTTINSHRLAALAESSNANNREAVVALVDYLKAKELGNQSRSTSDNGYMLASYTTNYEPTKTNKDSLMSIPYSLSMLGIGIGIIVTAVGVNSHRLQRSGRF
jgi:hypothetical protein